MKRLILGILTLSLIFGLSGCSDEKVPVKVNAIKYVTNMLGFEQKIPVVKITSLVDSVEITNVIANNGNCKMTAIRQKEFPQTVKYGNVATAGYTANCNLLKVKVITNQGDWEFEFDNIPEQYVQ